MRRTSALVAILCIFLGGCAESAAHVQPQAEDSPYHTLVLQHENKERATLRVEIARTPQEQSQGLMQRTSLEEGSGMLFVFEDSAVRSFWMKQTLLPLDILFFDSDGSFVSRASMVPCTADPCPLTSSVFPAAFALEVNAGEPQTQRVGGGWRIALQLDGRE